MADTHRDDGALQPADRAHQTAADAPTRHAEKYVRARARVCVCATVSVCVCVCVCVCLGGTCECGDSKRESMLSVCECAGVCACVRLGLHDSSDSVRILLSAADDALLSTRSDGLCLSFSDEEPGRGLFFGDVICSVGESPCLLQRR